MTAEERRRAGGRGAVCGLILGGFLGVIGILGMLIGRDSFLTGAIILLLLPSILMGISFWKLKPLTDQSWKDFLASTQWSKEEGFTSDKIVLRRS